MDLIMVHNQIKDEVLALSRSPKLGVLDADALAALLVDEIQSTPDLSPHVRGALVGTAAILIKHSRDCAAAENETDRLLDRMTHAGDVSHD